MNKKDKRIKEGMKKFNFNPRFGSRCEKHRKAQKKLNTIKTLDSQYCRKIRKEREMKTAHVKGFAFDHMSEVL